MDEATPRAPGEGPSRLDSLTGLRFMAALLVFATHLPGVFGTAGVEPFARADRYFAPGATGVTFFFVLSGFVLAWSHRPGDTPAAFFRRRLARIGPAYAVVWAVALVLTFLHHEPVSAAVIVVTVLLLQAWVPREGVVFALNGVMWTLSVEAFLYATFPWLRPRLAALAPPRRRGLLVALLAAATLLGVVAHSDHWSGLIWAVLVSPPCHLIEFSAGILLALELQAGRIPRVGRLPATGLVVLGLVAISIGPGWAYAGPVMTLPYTVLIASFAHWDRDGRGRAAPTFVRLGTWSYAFYLVHVTVMIEIARALPRVVTVGSIRWPGAVLLASVSGLAALGAAVLLFSVVERPLERRLRPPGRPRLEVAPTGGPGAAP